MKNYLFDWLNRIAGRDDGPETMIDLERNEPDEFEACEAPWAAGGSDCGRVRVNNEDDFLCDQEKRLFAVADGMGGHAAGEIASSTVIDDISQSLTRDLFNQACEEPGRIRELLAHALEHANEAVLTAADNDPNFEGMGSTIVVAALCGTHLHVMNVGDSRVYLCRDHDTLLLTEDHSVAAELVRQGQLTTEEARVHPLRNHLTACLGLPKKVEPAFNSVAVTAGDIVLLCSDGLWERVVESEIERIVRFRSDPRDAVAALINAANESGGQDNITAVVIRIIDEESGMEEVHALAAETESSENNDRESKVI